MRFSLSGAVEFCDRMAMELPIRGRIFGVGSSSEAAAAAVESLILKAEVNCERVNFFE